MENTKTKPKNPIEAFFNLAPKDPLKKAHFDYLLMFIIFLGFGYMFFSNLYLLFVFHNFASLGWCFVTGGIMYFNYSGLVAMRSKYYLVKRMKEPNKNDDIDKVMQDFKKKRRIIKKNGQIK